jgi:hypothetical protein
MHLEIYLCSAINGAVGVVLSRHNNFKKNNTIRKPPAKKIIYKNFFHSRCGAFQKQ